MHDPIGLLTVLTLKHFICDFPLQATPYMYANKGNWRHPGGYLHALIHAGFTMMVLAVFFDIRGLVLFGICAAEFVAHYLIDFSKVNIGKRYNLKPDNSEAFWILLGFDQLLHCLTYLAIAQYLVSHG